MALILCPECGKEVSSMAKACPQCGYPIVENTLEYKVRKIIIEDCCLTAMDYLETQGYSSDEAYRHVHNYINRHPECIANKISGPIPLQCPKCGSRSVKDVWFSIYDHKCQVCGHEWVKCPECGKSNIEITKAAPISAVKSSFNKCKNCGHEWRRY